jgi:hypothetical protein
MVRTTDKVLLKTKQLRGIIDKKSGNTTEHNIQQFTVLQSFLEIDLANEAGARQRYLTKMAGKQIPTTDVPLGGYILDTDYTAFCDNIVEYATFKRLFFTTGYSKAYWNNPNIWRHAELDMCHIRTAFGGCIALLTHSTSNGRNKILAFGIVTVENKHEWTLFYNFCKEHFKNIAHITNDQDKGLKSIEQTNIRQGELKHVSHCVAHIVRNENRARGLAHKGGFDISAAGSTVQSLYTSLAKACTDEMWDHYFAKLQKGNDFTADYVLQRKALISTSYLLDTISTGKETVLLSGPIPPQARRGKVTSNTAEQCNSNCGINKYRELPILDMVKGIATTMAKQHFKASRSLFLNSGI